MRNEDQQIRSGMDLWPSNIDFGFPYTDQSQGRLTLLSSISIFIISQFGNINFMAAL